MNRQRVRQLMQSILENQGRRHILEESDGLADIGFRSLDFSELALRVESEVGRELIFDASRLREITNVGDVITFLLEATRA